MGRAVAVAAVDDAGDEDPYAVFPYTISKLP